MKSVQPGFRATMDTLQAASGLNVSTLLGPDPKPFRGCHAHPLNRLANTGHRTLRWVLPIFCACVALQPDEL